MATLFDRNDGGIRGKIGGVEAFVRGAFQEEKEISFHGDICR